MDPIPFSRTGQNRPDPTQMSPLALNPTPRPLPVGIACHPRPPPTGSGRWRGVAAETSAGQTIGALCGLLELTGPALRHCAPRHTHADKVCWRGIIEQMTGFSASHANLLSLKLLLLSPGLSLRPSPLTPTPPKHTQCTQLKQERVKARHDKRLHLFVLLSILHLQPLLPSHFYNDIHFVFNIAQTENQIRSILQ